MIKKESIFSVVIISAVFILLSVTPVLAEVIGQISFVDGRVDILKHGQDIAVPVEAGASLSSGDIIRTKSNSRAEITFLDNSAVRLAEGTRVGINNYLLNDKGERKDAELTLFRGKMRALISKSPDTAPGISDFKVNTAEARADAMGTDFYFIHESGSSWFYGAKGSVWALSRKADDPSFFAEAFLIDRRKCARIASGVPMQGSCYFNDIDVEKHQWDTATVTENLPVVAELKSKEEAGEVFTYTPLDGRAVGTPSLTVTVEVGDLACPQCPQVGVPPVEAQDTIKMGDFERIDTPTPPPDLGEPFQPPIID